MNENEKTVDVTIDNLIDILQKTGKNYNLEKINYAFEYAKALHEGQFRASGEAYISHPVAVAEIAAQMELDTDSICAALLHDTVEDCADKTDIKDLEKKFGADVATLVDGLTKLVIMNVEDKEEAHIENIRKMLFAMSKDIRVIFIKLCDRLHNMRTLSAKPGPRQRVIALETMQVYAPLAHRLGMQKIKQELENLGIYYLDPIGYEEVRNDINRKYGLNRDLLQNVQNQIESKLKENGIGYTLYGRVKSVYSIYKKMYNQNKSFDEIYDFYAIRIIVNTELECYTVLGLIHEMFSSIPGRFKDYISTPKPNLYRSLHTTVIGRDGIPFEVQIRTWDMHHEAEYGVAAHWKYKSGEQSSKEDIDKRLEWIARLVETEVDARDPDEFLQAIKTDIFQEETYIFTPKGDLIALPQGSTVIDFAYAIHSQVGNKMVGAKINGMIVPIDRVPNNGEIVEIITSSSSKGPSRDWLKIVNTSEARSKIRAWFKKEKRADNIVVGRSMIDGELKRYGRSISDAQKMELLTIVAPKAGFTNPEDLLNALGYGGISLSKIANKLREEFDKIVHVEDTPVDNVDSVEQVKISDKPKNIKSNSGIIVDGEYGCQVKFAKCCNPLPGDDVIGFVTKGYGISIHKLNCPNVIAARKNGEDERWVEAYWESGSRSDQGSYEAILQLYVDDRIGLIADVTMALADMKVPILYINSQKRSNDRGIINIKISCRNTEHYNMIVDRLNKLDGVRGITRGFLK